MKKLCRKHKISFEKMKQWYDGYQIGREKSMFNPYSVMEAIRNDEFSSYWSNTGAYDAVSTYIQMNFDGLKDDIINMLAGGRCGVDTVGFTNDMKIIRSKDDVFTVLIHLGYLAYDQETLQCFIPNKEVAMEFEQAIKNSSWDVLVRTIANTPQAKVSPTWC